MSKDSGVYLAAIHDCIRRIRLYTEDGKDAYFADTRTQDAVMRNIYVLGCQRRLKSDPLVASFAD